MLKITDKIGMFSLRRLTPLFYVLLGVFTILVPFSNPEKQTPLFALHLNHRSISSTSFPIDQILSIPKSGTIHNDLGIKIADINIKNISGDYPIVKFIEAKLNPNEAYRIIPAIKESVPVVEIFYDKAALNDLPSTIYLKSLLTKFLQKSFNTPASFHEYYFNSRATKNFSLKVANTIAFSALNDSRDLLRGKYPEYVNDQYFDEIQNKMRTMERQNRIFEMNNTQTKHTAKTARVKKMQDYLATLNDHHLKMLVMNNKRKEVAHIISMALPWEDFNKVEEEFWKISLDAIRNPVPFKDRILVYRGIGEIPTYALESTGKEMSVHQSYEKNDFFILSNMFNNNSGDIHQGLSRFDPIYNKIISKSERTQELVKDTTLTTIMHNHSGSSKFSPMISMTPRTQVAGLFAKGKVIAAAIDPRLLNYNFANTLIHEVEFLTPFMLFPEDIVANYNSNYQADLGPSDASLKEYLRAKTLAHIRNQYGGQDALIIYNNMTKRSDEFFSKSKKIYENYTKKLVTLPVSNNIANIYRKIEKENPSNRPQVLRSAERVITDDYLKAAKKVVTTTTKTTTPAPAINAQSCQAAVATFFTK